MTSRLDDVAADDPLLRTLVELQERYIYEGLTRAWWDFALERVIALTGAGFGFIGRVAEVDGRRVLISLGVTDIAWNDWSREVYDTYAAEGLTFDNPSSLFGVTLMQGATVIANDPANDPRAGGLPEGHPPLVAYCGIPVADRSGMVGMIGLANRPGGFNDAFVERLRPITAFIGEIVGRDILAREHAVQTAALAETQHAERAALIAQARLESRVAQLEDEARELRLANEAVHEALLASALSDVRAILRRVLAHGNPGSSVCVYASEGGGRLVDDHAPLGGPCRIVIDEHACMALRSGGPHVGPTGGVSGCTHIDEGRVGICVPVEVAGERFGVVTIVVAADETTPTDLLEARAVAVVQSFAFVMATVALRESLRRQALTDDLTGLMNRPALVAEVTRLIASSQRNQRPCAMMLIDLDRFKAVNDEHGHHAGDEMLCRVADALRSQLRGGDYCARFGGDEFAIVLPDADLDVAMGIAERIKERIDAIDVNGSGVAASIGLIGCRSVDGPWTSWDDVYRAVDEALYVAKAEGRSAICVAD